MSGLEGSADLPASVSGFKQRLAERLARTERGLLAVYGRQEPRRDWIVDTNTDIVIEGFPRSGNTFSVIAFRVAQRPRKMKVAHHFHALGQIRRAVRLGKPTVVLLRDPVDAVASWLVRSPDLDPGRALANYTALYEGVIPLLGDVVVAPFHTVTHNYGLVIDQVNRRYGTDFVPYVNAPDNDQVVFSIIDAMNDRIEAGRASMLARPTGDRAELNSRAQRRVAEQSRVGAARRVFEVISEQAAYPPNAIN